MIKTKLHKVSSIIVFVLVMAGIGTYLLLQSRAASPFASVDASSGTLAGVASLITDTSTSSGKAVEFGSVSNSTDPSGVAMPVGNLTGWNQIFADDFTSNVSLGSGFPSGAYDNTWGTYGDIADNSGQSYYDNAKSVSVSNGELDIYMHTAGSENMCGEMYPASNGSRISQTYGMYSVRYRVDLTNGYGGVWLLWPQDGQWPLHGEIDFPEGGFNGDMYAYAHYANANGGQDNYSTNTLYGGWHTATTVWTPGKEQFYLDGNLIGTSTTDVPSTPMYYSFQCGQGTNETLNGTESGHMDVDWVVEYSYNP
jgi:hypothetical protein